MMKNIYIILTLVFLSFISETLTAQAPPQKMTYQFIARNAQNQLIQNNAVGLRISILQGSPTGNAVYVETHTPQANGNGTATIEVGGGTVVSGVFANINWSTGVYFIQTEMDPQGQQGYSVTAVSQLLSVPYAFYAGRATYADSVSAGMSETDPTFNASVAAGITPSDTARWNQDLVNDADSDPTNELQTLSVVGDSILLSGGGGSFALNDADTSQWKLDSFGIHYNQGNVGIGVNSDPLVSLNIIKDISSGGARQFINVHNTTNSTFSSADIGIKAGTGGDRTFLSHWGPNYTRGLDLGGFGGMSATGRGLAYMVHDSSAIKFITGSNLATPTEIARINRNGIGIGTSNPLSKFHIIGSSIIQDDNGSPHIPISFLDNTGFTRGQFRMISDPTYSILEMDALEPTPTSDVSIRFFRYTNTTGIKAVNFLRGNSSAQMSASIGVDGTNSYFQMHGGRLGIGTTTPDQLLSVNGNASKAGGGAWATFSDRRVKQDIQPFNEGLSVLKQLNPVSYKYNEKSGYSDLNKTFIGFIAQDVEKVAPYMVNIYDDSNGPSGLSDKRQFDESALSKIMLNAIKEQQNMIESQQKTIDELLKRVEKLEKR